MSAPKFGNLSPTFSLPTANGRIEAVSTPVAATAPALPAADSGTLVGAGIGAAGSAVGTLAALAGQQAQMQAATNNQAANNAFSEKMAKMQLGESSRQFDRNSRLAALQWALSQGKAQTDSTGQARDLRRTSAEQLSEVLARIFL